MNPNFPADAAPIKLYRHEKSGHCHRVELMMAFLGLPYETVEVDLLRAEHKSPEYLKLSPLGQVPAIDDNGQVMDDSNAILIYLVQRYATEHEWLPQAPLQAAQVQRWLSIAAGEIAYGPCYARLAKVFAVELDYPAAVAKARELFAVMDAHLQAQAFLAGDAITVADVSVYTYVAHVPEGGVDLQPYPAIRAWLARIEAYPGFVPMAASPLPEMAA